MIRRSGFLSAASAAACALALPSRAFGADSLKIATLPIDAAMTPFYAQQMEFYSKAGIAAEISTFTNGGASAQAMISGAADIGLVDTVSMASAHSRGVPIAFIAPGAVFTKAGQAYWLIVPSASPLQKAKDFAGKTIAVNGIKNITQVPTEGWLDANGGDAKAAKFIEMPFPAMVAALEKGTIDAAVVTEPTIALTAGKVRVISIFDNGIGVFQVNGYAATTDWIAKNKALAKRFATATIDANKWANAHPAETAKIISSVSKLAPEVLGQMSRAQYADKLDLAVIQSMIDASVRYGVIPKSFPARDVVATL